MFIEPLLNVMYMLSSENFIENINNRHNLLIVFEGEWYTELIFPSCISLYPYSHSFYSLLKKYLIESGQIFPGRYLYYEKVMFGE